MGGGPIDPTQILTGAQNLPNQFQPPQQPASMTPQVQNPGAMPGNDLDSQIKQQILQQGQMGMQGYQQTMGQMGDLGQRAQALQQQLGSMPLPKTGVTDEPWMKMQPVHGQGVGGDLKNLLSDIGRGMLAGVGATGPGRAIQQGLYGPGERAYGMQSRNLAQQIADIQGQQKTEAESLGPTTNLATRQGVNYGAVERGGASALRANTEAAMAPMKIELQAKAQELQKQIAAGKLTQAQAETEMRKVIALHHDATLQSVAGMVTDQRDRQAQIQDFEAATKEINEHPIQYFLGLGAPTSTQAGTISTPKAAGTKAPAKKSAGGPKPGDVEDGYRFKGGNAADPNSWEQVKVK